LFGQHAEIPVALAPIGMCGVFHPRAEIHVARAARAFGVPYCLSTLASCSIEDVAAAVGAPFLFQLYMMRIARSTRRSFKEPSRHIARRLF